MTRDEKVINRLFELREQREAEEKIIAASKERIEKIKAVEEKAEGLLLESLKKSGKSCTYKERTFYISQTKGSIEIPEIEHVPSTFIIEKTTKTADKKAIQKAVDAGKLNPKKSEWFSIEVKTVLKERKATSKKK